MTLDEAIAHAREVASEQKRRSGACVQNDSECDKFSTCLKCAKEHEQLAEWLEELKEYHTIGTPEEFKKCMDILNKSEANELSKIIDEWLLYHKLGSVEECRAAMEKQKAKKPKEYEDKFYACPVCGNVLMHKWEKYPTKLMDKKNELPYCLGCGQELDWSDEEC